MKKIVALLLLICLSVMMVACGNTGKETGDNSEAILEIQEKNNTTNQITSEITENSVNTENEEPLTDVITTSNILVVNFSCTGNTKPIAETVAKLLDADFYQIIPAVPYTDDDINYSDDNCRANKEQADDNARPEIAGEKIDVSGYDTVIISFPIWWGKEPRIIDTFMESYDLSGKTLTCFCTSGSSGIGTAETKLYAYVPDGNWLDGIRFETGASEEKIKAWLDDIGIVKSTDENEEEIEMANKMNVQVGDHSFTATLESNDAVNELVEMMKEAPVVLELDDYSGFEKVGPLGKSLTRSDKQTTTKSGDIVLYSGNNIVMFYGSNSWSYTRLGKIDDLTDWEKALGSGSVTVTFSLTK